MNSAINEIQEDFNALIEKYSELLPAYQLSFELISLSVKHLMDIAPKHKVALETIKIATEEGIRIHVEQKKGKS